mmetsp:Transcript_28715/g.53954  ORF Transcript_28715/g.53954 Transcript_28715/m.53954 type:complete len:480 (+) Transcript_28715:129-1568(+)
MKFSTIALAAFAAKSSFVMAKDNQHVSSVVNLRSPSTIEDRVLHPDSWYYQHNEYDHAQCTRPQPICDDCGYKRDQDYYHAMIESSQVEDGQLYTPPDTEIKCGGETLSGFVKLTSNLVCDADADETNDGYDGGDVKAITISGPGSVLDCDGNTIMMPVGTAPGDSVEDGSVGIVLENGAFAINCKVSGFNTGVWMKGRNNVLKNSLVGGATTDNISTSGYGCMTVDGVESVGAGEDGLQIDHAGTMQVFASTFQGNGDEVGDGIFTDDGVDLCFTADEVNAIGNSGRGLNLFHSGPAYLKRTNASFNEGDAGVFRFDDSGSTLTLEDVKLIGNVGDGLFAQDVDITTYGTVTSLGNGDDGVEFLAFSGNNVDINVKGDLVLEGSGSNGLSLDNTDGAVSVSVKDCAFLKSCSNIDPDIVASAGSGTIMFEEGVDVTCDEVHDDLIGEFSCSKDCPNDIGTGTICSSPVAAYCYPKPEW